MGRREQLVEQLLDPPEPDLRPGLDLGGLVAMAEDPPVERIIATSMLVAPRSATRTWPGPGLERQLARRPAAGSTARVALDDEAAFDELADPLGDDRPPEARSLDELRSRPRPAEPDLVEDEDQRVERLVGQRAGHAADHTA